jgi:NAD(P)-dependent dehydrogenase (short-subunit alcohol dehydrogenase family)
MAKEQSDLEGKVAIVTGGAGGIGRVYCRALAEAGAAVVVADLNEAGAKAAADELAADGHRAIGVALDVTDLESAKAAVAEATNAFGGVDILVNNAGIMSALPKGKLMDVPVDAYELAIRVNALSVLVCSQAAVPAMRARGGGKIINQASTAAFEPGGLYRLSKHAVVSLTAALAHELGRDNFNVNAIAPGMIQTEEGFRSAGAVGSDRRTARAAGVPNVKPDREPDALVGALLLLASPAGDYINGQTLIVDGGRNTRL